MIKYEIPGLLKEHENPIIETFRYSNEIRFMREKTKAWESKLGGCPYLTDIKDYPTDETGEPMLFLTQLDLPDLEKAASKIPVIRSETYRKVARNV